LLDDVVANGAGEILVDLSELVLESRRLAEKSQEFAEKGSDVYLAP